MSEYITSFQTSKTLSERQQMASAIRKKYPERLAIILDRTNSLDPVLKKNKFLVPGGLTLGQFIYVVRKRLKLEAPHRPISEKESLYIHVHNTNIFPCLSDLMANIALQHEHQDKFLYLNYGLEHAFG